VTVHEEVDEVTGLSRRIIIESADEKKRQPMIEVKRTDGHVRKYHMPNHAHLMVEDGETVFAGDVLAKIPRETTKTKDITGGLPRVVELFEARKPRDTAAVISEVDGTVRLGGIVKGYREIFVVPEGEGRGQGRARSTRFRAASRQRAGRRARARGRSAHRRPDQSRTTSWPSRARRKLQNYLVNEIQEVYRLQGVNINDKHIEVIVRQMMRWVKIEDVGDTEFLVEEQVDRFRFQEENERVLAAGGHGRQGAPLLLGITKASLSTDSFISAASFQETTRVLTEAAISGKVDYLRGLKENVTMGRLIPAGTGFDYYKGVRIPADEPPPPPPAPEEDLDLERDELEYFGEAVEVRDENWKDEA
jgi:DNA-directed RNA polymerase subunit beta'